MTTTTNHFPSGYMRKSRPIRRSSEGFLWDRLGLTEDMEYYAIRNRCSGHVRFVQKSAYDDTSRYAFDIPSYVDETNSMTYSPIEVSPTRSLRFLAYCQNEIVYEFFFDYIRPSASGVSLYRNGNPSPCVDIIRIENGSYDYRIYDEMMIGVWKPRVCNMWKIERNPYFRS